MPSQTWEGVVIQERPAIIFFWCRIFNLSKLNPNSLNHLDVNMMFCPSGKLRLSNH
jgi:hypothetical protein